MRSRLSFASGHLILLAPLACGTGGDAADGTLMKDGTCVAPLDAAKAAWGAECLVNLSAAADGGACAMPDHQLRTASCAGLVVYDYDGGPSGIACFYDMSTGGLVGVTTFSDHPQWCGNRTLAIQAGRVDRTCMPAPAEPSGTCSRDGGTD
jgi:hypothetical protein